MLPNWYRRDQQRHPADPQQRLVAPLLGRGHFSRYHRGVQDRTTERGHVLSTVKLKAERVHKISLTRLQGLAKWRPELEAELGPLPTGFFDTPIIVYLLKTRSEYYERCVLPQPLSGC